MPANPKYLTQSSWQKFAKLSAGILGGYIISALLHMVLPILLVPYHKEMLITSLFTLYALWVVLMIIPYLFKNGWMAWGVYILSIILLYGAYYLLTPQNPFV